MSSIRLTYAGLIAFGIRLVSILTGMAFTLFVTRDLSPEDFGAWRLIGSFVAYVLVIDPIVNYWVQRQIARNEEVAKSAIMLNSVLSVGAISTYIIIITVLSGEIKYEFSILLLGAILIPLTFLCNTFDGINFGFKPQAASYAFLAFELVKVPIGFLLIVVLDYGISGAIIATAIALTVRVIVSGYYAKERFRGRIQIRVIKNWLRMMWLPLYSNISSVIFSLDILVFTLIIRSLEVLAVFAAAGAISGIIGYANSISQSLTPKLIAEKNSFYVYKILRTVLMFSIPITIATIIFAKPALFVLNPIYEEGYRVVVYWSIWGFLYIFTEISLRTLQGIEDVDANGNSTHKDFLKSKLFLVPTMYIIHYSIYIISLAVLLVINKDNTEPIKLLEYWALLNMFLQIPFLIWGWVRIKKEMIIKFPLTNLVKYIVATSITAAIILSIQDFILLYQKEIFVFAPRLILIISIGAGIYFGILSLIDRDFRGLITSIMVELRGINKQ